MTPGAQRIAVAECCPKVARIDGAGVPVWRDRYEYGESSYNPHHMEFDPTDYLNAMHEAERVLDGYMMLKYASELMALTGGNGTGGSFSHIHATAAQRAEAFLRTMGKWVD